MLLSFKTGNISSSEQGTFDEIPGIPVKVLVQLDVEEATLLHVGHRVLCRSEQAARAMGEYSSKKSL